MNNQFVTVGEKKWRYHDPHTWAAYQNLDRPKEKITVEIQDHKKGKLEFIFDAHTRNAARLDHCVAAAKK